VCEEYERSYDLDLEKKKHEAYLKDLRKIIRGQKALVEKVERMMRQSEMRGQTKTRKYRLASNETKSMVAEQAVRYKSKKK
jgi:predicted KAP-like P-loop ATPase